MRIDILRLLAWLSLAIIVVVSVVPGELRPHSGQPVQIERFLPFAISGLLLSIAFPRRFIFVPLTIFGLAVGLEVLQLILPSRHGGLDDLATKLIGGTAGIGAGWLFGRWFCRAFPQSSAKR